jgi:diguanylate cyclase (GGDEF)-like protein/PAS domain S-box-containing protein
MEDAERKGAEERIRFQARLLDAVGESVIATDVEGKAIYWNRAAEVLYGWSEEEVIGQTLAEFVISKDLRERAAEIRSELRKGKSWSGEFIVQRKDGTTFPAMVTSTPVHDERGSLVGMIGVSADITERKQVEEALKESEERFRSTFDEASIGMAVNSFDGRFLQVNRTLCEMLGYSEEELLGTNFQAITHPDDLDISVGQVQRLLEGELGGYQIEKRYLHAEGYPVWVSLSVSLAKDSENCPLHLIAQMQGFSKRKQTDDALRESEERYRSLVELSPDAILVHSEGKVVYVNTAGAKLLGAALPDKLTGKPALGFIHPDYREIARERVRLVLIQRKQVESIEEKIVCLDGRVMDAEVSGSFILYQGKPAVQNVIRDITERKEAEENLRKSEARLGEAQRIAHLGSWERDVKTGEESWSDETFRIYGYEPKEVVPTLDKVMELVHPDDRELIRKKIDAALYEGEPYDFEHRIVRADGEVRWIHRRGEVVREEGGEPLRIIGTVHDITEHKALEKRLEYQAYHDELTDLPNRRLFIERLKQALRRTRRRRIGRKVAVLFMDLDNFKVVNDSLGHEAGDLLLVAAGERVRWCLRPEDTLARLGGDEFAVLLEEVEAPSDVAKVAERIVERFRAPFVVEGREFVIRPSIGIALGTARQKTAEDLLRDADTAMYQAKGREDHYRVFDPNMYEQALRRLKLEGDLRRAIDDEEFVVCYQPIVNLETGEASGVEALVRWEHPEQQGLLAPSQFIPVAEEAGLVVPMGRWVLEEACRQGAKWQQEHPHIPPLVISVNLSAKQLQHPDVAEMVEETLKETGFDARCLSLDITETLYIEALKGNTAALDKLKKMGVSISIDDFGTGYSSLAYLKRLPAETLKIDKSFIKGIGEDIEDTAIVRMIIELAHTLGMEAIAEGVESEEQAEQLKEMGCDRGQGYYFARPLPSEEATRFLSR